MEKTFKADLCVIEDIKDAAAIIKKRTEKVKALAVVDLVVPPNSPEVSLLQKEMKEAAHKKDVPYFYARGKASFIAIKEHLKEGEIVVGLTPDIAAVGAVGAYGVCVNPDEMQILISGGELTFGNLKAVKIEVSGFLCKELSSRDLAFTIIEKIGENQLFRDILELYGSGVTSLNLEERITLCTLLQKTGAIPVIKEGKVDKKPVLSLKAEDIVPMVVFPGNYQKIVSYEDVPFTEVKCVFIGGTAGGSIEEIEKAATMLKGRKIAYGVRLSVSPATADIYCEAANRGFITDIMRAGGLVLNQCASPEIEARVGKNEVLLSNDVENKKAYAGVDESSRTFICNTKVAIEAALNGHIGKKTSQTENENKENNASMLFEGRCWKLGDDIDTDIIIPTQHLSYETMDEIKKHAFEPLRPELQARFREGDIIVAGSNFGCGSSREQAAEVILANGIHCIIAKSFARIFFRNAINNGILLLECRDLPDEVSEGDTVRVDLNKRIVTANGRDYSVPAVPENLFHIIMDGGLIGSIMKKVEKGEL